MAVEDLASDDRWPEHHDTARAVGHGGLVCVPMPVGHDPVGALHLFDEGRVPGPRTSWTRPRCWRTWPLATWSCRGRWRIPGP